MQQPNDLDDGLYAEPDIRWELTEASFWRWWRSIPPEDRDEFSSFHHGKEPHARFVCALDQLLIVQKREQVIGTIVEAYSLATGAHPSETSTARDARESWQLDPVQFLFGQIRRRTRQNARARIEGLVTAALEKRLEAHLLTPDAKDTILKDGLAFLKLVQGEDERERSERLERGVARLKGDAEARLKAIEMPSDDTAAEYLKMLVSRFGRNRFAGILEKALPREAGR